MSLKLVVGLSLWMKFGVEREEISMTTTGRHWTLVDWVVLARLEGSFPTRCHQK
jgi:hypothetical protein